MTYAPCQLTHYSPAASKVAGEGIRIAARPAVDSVHLKRHPFEPDAPSQSTNVPLLIGSLQTELSLLVGARKPELFDLTWQTLPAALEDAIEGIDANAVIAGL